MRSVPGDGEESIAMSVSMDARTIAMGAECAVWTSVENSSANAKTILMEKPARSVYPDLKERIVRSITTVNTNATDTECVTQILSASAIPISQENFVEHVKMDSVEWTVT